MTAELYSRKWAPLTEPDDAVKKYGPPVAIAFVTTVCLGALLFAAVPDLAAAGPAR